MKQQMTALFLTGMLTCSLAAPAGAVSEAPDLTQPPVVRPLITPSPNPIMADSLLYYGTVAAIETNELNQIVRLTLDSPRSGRYVMNLNEKTAFVDSTARTASNPATIAVGEQLYVFHSAMVTRSLPPQAAAFAVVRNPAMDISVGRYHEAEALEQAGGTLTITTDNGSLRLLVDGDTEITTYEGHPAALADVKAGSFLMAWYEGEGEVHADTLLLLPYLEGPITRAKLAQLLHRQAGCPSVDYLMQFEDVAADVPELEAIRWITGSKIMNGYTPQQFGYFDEVTLEQAVTALWRSAHSPQLMDYPGLTQYKDAGDISPYAAQAMAWAHQKNLLDRTVEWLRPGAPLSAERADKLLRDFAAL